MKNNIYLQSNSISKAHNKKQKLKIERIIIYNKMFVEKKDYEQY